MRKIFFLTLLVFNFTVSARGAPPQFRSEIIFQNSPLGDQPRAIYPADLNGDQSLDIVAVASSVRMVWYANDGTGHLGSQRSISDNESGISDAVAHDLDGDGDADILVGRAYGNSPRLQWYENLDGNGSLGPPQTLSGTVDTREVHAADLNGDGRLEVLALNPYTANSLFTFSNLGQGNFGPATSISFPNMPQVYALETVDLEGDGDLDVLLGGDGGLYVYKNDGGGNLSSPTQLSTVTPIWNVRGVDIEGDGDQDLVLAARDSGVVLLRNNGLGGFAQETLSIETGRRALAVADLDGDGDPDLVSSPSFGPGPLLVLENRTPQAGFTSHVLDTGIDYARTVYTVDMDRDGHLDIVMSAASLGAVLYRGQGTMTFGGREIITPPPIEPTALDAEDLDGDGDPDALVGSNLGTGWIATGSNAADFSGYQSLGSEPNITQVRAVDLDQDNDLDILTAASPGPALGWYSNNGAGNFGTHQVIDGDTLGARDAFAADLNQDGFLDIVTVASTDFTATSAVNELAWRPGAGGGSFGAKQIIDTSVVGARAVHAADLDGDGDLDVLSASSGDGKIAWYRNDGLTFSSQSVIGIVNDAWTVTSADLDGDGDLDVLASGYAELGFGTHVWFANAGAGNFGPPSLLTDRSGGCVGAADIDQDGDPDLVVPIDASFRMALFENTDGFATAGLGVVLSESLRVSNVAFADVDGDADLDIFSISRIDGRLEWHENTGTVACTPNPCRNGGVCTPTSVPTDPYTCNCDATGFSGPRCTLDINQCQNATFPCGANATCTNTPNGFTCACNAGYSGDGLLCAEIDECTAGTANCDVNATCTNTPGSFTCACNAGYSGDGQSCVPDTCSGQGLLCDANANCDTTATPPSCVCNTGFLGDGTTCTDIDECATGVSNCNSSATCTNTPGGFACTCNSGYVGNGVTCLPDSCNLAGLSCASDATCVDTSTGPTCTCLPGFSGDGLTCLDIDECSAGLANCATDATCTNTAGAFSCVCNAGYQGDGTQCDLATLASPAGSAGSATGAAGCAASKGGVSGWILCVIWGFRRRRFGKASMQVGRRLRS